MKGYLLVTLLAILLSGCVNDWGEKDAALARERFSNKILATYNQCLENHKSQPAQSTFNCYPLYGMAAYYRQDFVTAYRTFAPLSEQSEPRAQHFLGLMYTNGYGVPKNIEKGIELQQRAAALGHAPAMSLLATYYENGEGVPQDYKLAMQWKESAANHGDTLQFLFLGIAYTSGKLTPRDTTRAYMWLSLAIASNDSVLRGMAEQSRKELENEMTIESITAAQRLTREWRPRATLSSP